MTAGKIDRSFPARGKLKWAALAAGISAELDLAAHHWHANPAHIAWWPGGGLAVFSLALWATRDRYHSSQRILALPAMAAVSLGAAYTEAPNWAFALVAIIALVWRGPIFCSSRHDLHADSGRHR
jgi:hypothetical protein